MRISPDISMEGRAQGAKRIADSRKERVCVTELELKRVVAALVVFLAAPCRPRVRDPVARRDRRGATRGRVPAKAARDWSDAFNYARPAASSSMSVTLRVVVPSEGRDPCRSGRVLLEAAYPTRGVGQTAYVEATLGRAGGR